MTNKEKFLAGKQFYRKPITASAFKFHTGMQGLWVFAPGGQQLYMLCEEITIETFTICLPLFGVNFRTTVAFADLTFIDDEKAV